MNHLELSFSDKAYKHRVLLFILCIVLIGVTLFVQMIATSFSLLAAYSFEMESLTMLPNMAALSDMDRNVFLLAIAIPFAIALLFLLLITKAIHRHSFTQLVNGTKSIRWKRVGFAFALWFGIMAIHLMGTLLFNAESLTLQFNIEQFIPLLLISICLLPIQTTFEEVLIRGHLAQGVAMLTRSRWLSLLFPALIFAILHINNPEVEAYGVGIMLPTYFTVAIIWGLAAILDDGLEIGIGAHAANNIFISLFTTQQDAAFETYAVFEMQAPNPYISLLELLIMGAIVLFVCYRKYKWSFNTLNKKIEKPKDSSLSVS